MTSGAGKASVFATVGLSPVSVSKTSSPTWDRGQLEGHSIGKIPKTITRRSIASGALKANRSTIRPDICGRMSHRHRFPRFEIQTSKSITYLGKSRTNEIEAPESVPVPKLPVCPSANHLHREDCLLYTSPSPRDGLLSRMPSSA